MADVRVWTTWRGAVLASAILLLRVSAPTAAAAQGTCAQPYSPVFVDSRNGGGISQHGVEPEVASWLNAPAIIRDTDGDGIADTVDVAPDFLSITIHRGDGDVILTNPPSGQLSGIEWLGDLNGDGRIDFRVTAYTSDLAHPTTDVIVPAPSTPGTYDVLAIGVAVSNGLPGPDSLPIGNLKTGGVDLLGVGDQNGDGLDDAHISTYPVPVPDIIASGADLLAPGPGGQLTTLPTSVVALEGRLVGVFALDASAPTELADFDRPNHTLIVRDGPTVTRLAEAGGDETSRAEAFLSTDGHHIVELGTSGRGGESTQMWDLDDPCSAATLVAPTTAPPTTASDEGLTQPSAALPRTGKSSSQLVGVAVSCFLLGCAMFSVARARSRLDRNRHPRATL